MKTCQYYNDKQKTENSGMGRRLYGKTLLHLMLSDMGLITL